MTVRRLTGAGLLALALAAAACPAEAVTVADYQKWRHATRAMRATPTGLIEVRLGGVLSALQMVNTLLIRNDGPLLFCPPGDAEDGGMGGGDMRKLVDSELKSPSRPGGEPWPADTAVSAVVLYILKRKWPCTDGRPPVR